MMSISVRRRIVTPLLTNAANFAGGFYRRIQRQSPPAENTRDPWNGRCPHKEFFTTSEQGRT
jgi:hypothetical protein